MPAFLLGLIPGVGQFLKGLPWKWILIGLAAVGALFLLWRAPWAESRQKAKDDIAIGRLTKQIDAMTKASEAAHEFNVTEVKAQETAQAAHTEDRNHDDQIRAAAAADAVAAWVRLHPYTRNGSCGALGLPACPDPAGVAAAEDANALVHDPVVVPAADLQVCKTAVLKGQSFDAWWPGAAKIMNDAADKSAAEAAAEER